MAQRQREEKRRGAKARIRKLWASIIGLPIIGIVGLYLTYTYTGADGLRTEVYEPLYEEVGKIENCLQANVLEQGFTSPTYEALQKTGKLERIPKSLRAELQDAYAKSGTSWGYLLPVLHRIEILTPDQIKQVRTPGDDVEWTQKTVKQLNRELDLRGLGGVYARFQFQHTGHSFAIDQRDPAHPKISEPAAVTWQVNDWLGYPKSAEDVDSLWNQVSYLEFDPKVETWIYRITREDLDRKHFSLQEFLKPVYVRLSADADFQQLVSGEREALQLIRDLKQTLAERVKTPKELRDLIFD